MSSLGAVNYSLPKKRMVLLTFPRRRQPCLRSVAYTRRRSSRGGIRPCLLFHFLNQSLGRRLLSFDFTSHNNDPRPQSPRPLVSRHDLAHRHRFVRRSFNGNDDPFPRGRPSVGGSGSEDEEKIQVSIKRMSSLRKEH